MCDAIVQKLSVVLPNSSDSFERISGANSLRPSITSCEQPHVKADEHIAKQCSSKVKLHASETSNHPYSVPNIEFISEADWKIEWETLKTLNLQQKELTDKEMSLLAQQTHLKALYLKTRTASKQKKASITQRGLKELLLGLPNTVITLNPVVSECFSMELKKKPEKYNPVQFIQNITRNIPDLQRITLEGFELDHQAARILVSAYPKVTSLNLSTTESYSDQNRIGSEGMSWLTRYLTKLKRLAISNSQFNSGGNKVTIEAIESLAMQQPLMETLELSTELSNSDDNPITIWSVLRLINRRPVLQWITSNPVKAVPSRYTIRKAEQILRLQ